MAIKDSWLTFFRRLHPVANLTSVCIGIAFALFVDMGQTRAVIRNMLETTHCAVGDIFTGAMTSSVTGNSDLMLGITYAEDDQRAIDIHYSSARTGYVSLWNIGSSGAVTRLQPSPEKAAHLEDHSTRVEAGLSYPVAVYAQGSGEETLVLFWTRTPYAQPPHGRFNCAASFFNALESAAVDYAIDDWEVAQLQFKVDAYSLAQHSSRQ